MKKNKKIVCTDHLSRVVFSDPLKDTSLYVASFCTVNMLFLLYFNLLSDGLLPCTVHLWSTFELEEKKKILLYFYSALLGNTNQYLGPCA